MIPQPLNPRTVFQLQMNTDGHRFRTGWGGRRAQTEATGSRFAQPTSGMEPFFAT